ncbi:ABC transporter substrate-binding protein [Aerosakkonemataceae cyanobacterium BLCC-F50]|uniref:ABC transporter substrate-binding protein n=1 Tax=Floridaenema flaviceps BLCC-F50 TaxID=3153642 RepID=A0ABV4XR46_9CYAN
MHPRKIIVFLSLLVLALTASIGIAIFNSQNQEKITIAIAVPSTNVGETIQRTGNSMFRGAQLYINQVNKAGGIQGKLLELKRYDDQHKLEVAEEVAKKIVQSKAIAIIGHSSSTISKAAGKIYQDSGIPAISGSATADTVTEGNDWYFRTIFADSYQGRFIAHYLKQVLGYSKICLIHSDDTYGLGLGQTIEATFRELGGNIVTKWQLDPSQNKATDELIIQQLKKLKELGQAPEAVVFATNRDQVINLIAQMTRQNLKIPLFGADDLGDIGNEKTFANLPEERNNKGFFTNGLYATAPIIYDVANDQAQKLRRTFEEIHKDAPGWYVASYYDTASAVVEAIKRTLLTNKDLPKTAFTGKNIKQDRYLVREGLAAINSPETAIQGTRIFYFDAQRNAVAPMAVGRFDKTNLVSAFIQLQAIPNLRTVPNLEAQIKAGNILQIGQQYLQKTDVVYVGMDINQVSNLDEKTSTYLMDCYLWFRYKGNVNAEKIEFLNYGVNRLNSGQKLTLDVPVQALPEQGVKHKVYRIKADFHEEFDFHNYPFDEQNLSIRFRHANLTRDKLIYAIDFVGMRDKSSHKITKEWKQQVFNEISAWIPQNISFYQDTLINESSLGYREVIDTNSNLEYSRFNVVIDIKRDLLSFSIKNLLPLWFFVAVAYALFFLPFEHFSADLLIGLLLAIVFYHLSLLQALPDGVGYVVALDYAFYIVYLLLGLELLIVIIGHKKSFQNSELKLSKLIMLGRIVFPGIILAACSLFYWLYFL